jgi:hypothetical protein
LAGSIIFVPGNGTESCSSALIAEEYDSGSPCLFTALVILNINAGFSQTAGLALYYAFILLKILKSFMKVAHAKRYAYKTCF